MGKLKGQLQNLRQQQQLIRQQQQKEHAKQQKGKPPPGKQNQQQDNTIKNEIRHRNIYRPEQKILLVGEANFSFTRALLRQFKLSDTKTPTNTDGIIDAQFDIDDNVLFEANATDPGKSLLATTLDSRAVTDEKYPDAKEIITELEEAGLSILFEVDATNLQKTLESRYFRPGSAISTHPIWSAYCRPTPQRIPIKFDVIIFNFPHCGRGITDQDRNIRANQELLIGFMQSASHLLTTAGQLHVTLKQGQPYDSWQIKALAKKCGMQCLTSHRFIPNQFDGYAHRRTLGFQEGLSRSENEELMGKQCRTFVFGLSPGGGGPSCKKASRSMKGVSVNNKKRKRSGSIGSDSD